jgi:hypothetical protein
MVDRAKQQVEEQLAELKRLVQLVETTGRIERKDALGMVNAAVQVAAGVEAADDLIGEERRAA